MTLRPSVAVIDVTFAFEIVAMAPALTKCKIVVQYNTFSNYWLYRRGVLEFNLQRYTMCLSIGTDHSCLLLLYLHIRVKTGIAVLPSSYESAVQVL